MPQVSPHHSPAGARIVIAWAMLTGALASFGCDIRIPDGVFTCTQDKDCPPSQRCDSASMCRLPGTKPLTSEANSGSPTADGGPHPPPEVPCAAGQGWDLENNKCAQCPYVPACDGVGETSRLLILRRQGGVACICEAAPNYYTLSDGRAAPCDADGDGWVVDAAQAAIEGDSSTLRANAHCGVRRVAKLVLHNEYGDSLMVEDYSQRFGNEDRGIAPGLALYESARNDGSSPGSIPTYGHDPKTRSHFDTVELNSLTKACSDSETDYNDDGVPDLSASAQSAPNIRDRLALQPYYQQYTKFSYFIELHEAWYDEVDGEPVYHIQERARDLAVPQHVPMLVDQNFTGADRILSTYAQRCTRHADALYLAASGSGQPLQLGSPNTIGGDFVEFAQGTQRGASWRGMLHHTQYKCVDVNSQADYLAWNGDSSASERNEPHLLFVDKGSGQLARKDAVGQSRFLTWTLNDCQLQAVESDAPAHGREPRAKVPEIKCSRAAIATGVHWAAVGYEPYTKPYLDAARRGDYTRGCVNACLEPVALNVSHDCSRCDASGLGEAMAAADDTDTPVSDGNECTQETCDNVVGSYRIRAGANCGGDGVCDDRGQCTSCLSAARQCSADGSGYQTCDAGKWSSSLEPCMGSVCSGQGECGECMPKRTRCTANQAASETCNVVGRWGDESPCNGSICANDVCGECMPESRRCIGDSTQHCDGSGNWAAGTDCAYGCSGGQCDAPDPRDPPPDPLPDPRDPPCFVGGTPVMLSDGSVKAIEMVKAGESVLAYDVESRLLVSGLVTQLLIHEETPALVLLNGQLMTTPEHRFYVRDHWMRAGELGPGDPLTRFNVGALEMLSADPVQSTQSLQGPVTTYNLEVERVHTYFAGGYLVHNIKP
jgi:hypothetical protein